jgi:hypothetical protein
MVKLANVYAEMRVDDWDFNAAMHGTPSGDKCRDHAS